MTFPSIHAFPWEYAQILFPLRLFLFSPLFPLHARSSFLSNRRHRQHRPLTLFLWQRSLKGKYDDDLPMSSEYLLPKNEGFLSLHLEFPGIVAIVDHTVFGALKWIVKTRLGPRWRCRYSCDHRWRNFWGDPALASLTNRVATFWIWASYRCVKWTEVHDMCIYAWFSHVYRFLQ